MRPGRPARDGELLLLDTPDNLRRAAFDGEVVDVTTVRALSPDELRRLGEFDFVIGGVDELAPNEYRIVVDDADRALLDLNQAFEALGVDLVEASEHEVDYDEAFVRVVERHRGADDEGRLEDEDDPDGDADGRPDDGQESAREAGEPDRKHERDRDIDAAGVDEDRTPGGADREA